MGDTVMRFVALAIAAALLAFPGTAHAAGEQVGQAVSISTRVFGETGDLSKGGPIHRDERITTNRSGVGSFLFDDGTKLAIGPDSTVVIDEYVYGGEKTAKSLAISTAKGTFRWISGKSDSSAYRITTPSGTVGVRGTAFDVYVGPNGVTAVVLLTGKVDFCNSSGCQQLDRRCDYLIARPNGEITKPRGIVRRLGDGRNAEQTFPFLAGAEALPRGFKGNSGCAGLNTGVIRTQGGSRSPEKENATRSEPRGNGRTNTGGGNDNPDKR